MPDLLQLDVRDVVAQVHTGVYSEETGRPQPLRVSVLLDLELPDEPYLPDTPLAASKDYMDIKKAILNLPDGLHFTLIEAVAEHICAALFAQDARVRRVEVKIVKLAISQAESIGMTLVRYAGKKV